MNKFISDTHKLTFTTLINLLIWVNLTRDWIYYSQFSKTRQLGKNLVYTKQLFYLTVSKKARCYKNNKEIKVRNKK